MLRTVLGGPSSLLLAALALSGVGLLAGPLILSLGRGRRTTGAMVDGLTLGLVPVMVVLRLLPHVAGELGLGAVGLALAAFMLLRAFDRAHHRAAARVGRAFIYSALALHSFTDGVSLAAAVAVTPSRGADLTLAAAFVIHRLPEGLFIATTLLPTYGWRRTMVRTVGLFLLTVAGGLAGGALLPHLSERWFDAVVALGLGAMLQLVLHSHADRPTQGITRALASLSLLVGVAVAILVPAPRDLLTLAQPRELPIVRSFGPLFIETAPALLLGLLATAGMRMLALRSLGNRLRGIALALSTPTGPSGVAQVARGFLAQGLGGHGVAMFTALAGGLAIDGWLVAARLLGPGLAVVGIVISLVVAIVIAAVVAIWASPAPTWTAPRAHVHTPEPPAWRAFVSMFLRDLDQRGAFYLAGLLAATALEAGIDGEWLTSIPTVAWLALAALVAIPCNLPLFATAPSVAVLLHKGLPIPAGFVLLVGGAITNAALLRVVTATRIRRAMVGAAIAVSCAALAASLSVFAPMPLALHALFTRAHDEGETIVAVVVAALLLLGLLRLGPGPWFAQLTLSGEAAAAATEHTHGHAHDHDGEHHHDDASR